MNFIHFSWVDQCDRIHFNRLEIHWFQRRIWKSAYQHDNDINSFIFRCHLICLNCNWSVAVWNRNRNKVTRICWIVRIRVNSELCIVSVHVRSNMCLLYYVGISKEFIGKMPNVVQSVDKRIITIFNQVKIIACNIAVSFVLVLTKVLMKMSFLQVFLNLTTAGLFLVFLWWSSKEFLALCSLKQKINFNTSRVWPSPKLFWMFRT